MLCICTSELHVNLVVYILIEAVWLCIQKYILLFLLFFRETIREKKMQKLLLIFLALLAESAGLPPPCLALVSHSVPNQKPCALLSIPACALNLTLSDGQEKHLQAAEAGLRISAVTVREGCLLSVWLSSSIGPSQQTCHVFAMGTYTDLGSDSHHILNAYSCSCRALGKKPPPRPSFKDFKNKHLVDPRTNGDKRFWNQMMRDRHLTHRTMNTFIYAFDDKAKKICQGQHLRENLYKSRNLFNITDVWRTKSSRDYVVKKKIEKHVIVACLNNVPVHLTGTSTK
ncbi:hypothetical protein HHUSO_G28022 [Huso huso]|uniref:Ribonuclease A-domain domain-containing protein n=1 Tax=Huso huso TaxID=61971 RepID=A0ABR0YIE2_HUSHU